MPAFDVAGARKAGYDDKEILSYVAGEENPDLLPGTDAEKIRLLLARNGKHMLDVEYLSPTQLEPMQEVQFQDWAKRNKVRLEPGWNEDYDMRGLWKANPGAVPDPWGHWPDTYKLPNHPTFSDQSVYATEDAPRWYGKRLIDSQGKVIADESDGPLDLPELPAPTLPQGLSGPSAGVPGSVPQTGERRNLTPQEADALWSEQGIQPTLPPTSLLDMAMLATSGPEQDAGIPLSMLAAVRNKKPSVSALAREAVEHTAVPKATLPRLTDNYLKPLSEYTPTLYRETNMPGVMDFLEHNVNPPTVLHGSNLRDLALGQGTNKGVTVELDTKGLKGQVNTRKPSWEMSYGKGEAEFEIKNPTSEALQESVRSITVKPEALKGREGKTWGTRFKNTMKQQGWEPQANPDGSVTYIKPTRE